MCASEEAHEAVDSPTCAGGEAHGFERSEPLDRGPISCASGEAHSILRDPPAFGIDHTLEPRVPLYLQTCASTPADVQNASRSIVRAKPARKRALPTTDEAALVVPRGRDEGLGGEGTPPPETPAGKSASGRNRMPRSRAARVPLHSLPCASLPPHRSPSATVLPALARKSHAPFEAAVEPAPPSGMTVPVQRHTARSEKRGLRGVPLYLHMSGRSGSRRGGL